MHVRHSVASLSGAGGGGGVNELMYRSMWNGTGTRQPHMDVSVVIIIKQLAELTWRHGNKVGPGGPRENRRG